MTRKHLPPAYARRLGRVDGRKRASSLTEPENDWRIGAVVEVYNALAWVAGARARDERAYLRGYADALSALLNGAVHLVFVRSRGNGHDDYEIRAGLAPQKRSAPKRIRHAIRTRRLQKSRRAMRWYAWYDGEARAVCALLGRRGWEAEVAARHAVIKCSKAGRKYKAHYTNGATRADVIRALGEP